MNSISLCMLNAVELTRKISPRLSHDPYWRAFCFLSCSMLGEIRLEENCKSFLFLPRAALSIKSFLRGGKAIIESKVAQTKSMQDEGERQEGLSLLRPLGLGTRLRTTVPVGSQRWGDVEA